MSLARDLYGLFRRQYFHFPKKLVCKKSSEREKKGDKNTFWKLLQDLFSFFNGKAFSWRFLLRKERVLLIFFPPFSICACERINFVFHVKWVLSLPPSSSSSSLVNALSLSTHHIIQQKTSSGKTGSIRDCHFDPETLCDGKSNSFLLSSHLVSFLCSRLFSFFVQSIEKPGKECSWMLTDMKGTQTVFHEWGKETKVKDRNNKPEKQKRIEWNSCFCLEEREVQ